MRVLVTGAAGQLAKAIRLGWQEHELILPDESDLDILDRDAIHRVVQEVAPDVLINCAAFTQVDRCETEVALAMRVNGDSVGWLAEACAREKALLVQISTDYVFDGTSLAPYRESDPTNPVSFYGKSKLAGEIQAATCPNHLIMRTAWLYEAWGKNFYQTMLNAAAQGRKLRVVADQRGCPTTCRALARQLKAAVAEGWRGVVHGTCSGETTWHGFAAEIFRRSGLSDVDLSPCTSGEYVLPAPRPAYSVLDGRHRAELGSDLMPPWEDALAEVIAVSQHH